MKQDTHFASSKQHHKADKIGVGFLILMMTLGANVIVYYLTWDQFFRTQDMLLSSLRHKESKDMPGYARNTAISISKTLTKFLKPHFPMFAESFLFVPILYKY